MIPRFANCRSAARTVTGRARCMSARVKRGFASATDRTIINPAKIPVRLAKDICMNFHQRSETRVLAAPARIFSTFGLERRSVTTLAILRIPIKRDTSSDLLEHHLSMQLSQCYRRSNGRLSCLTCHQIHSMPRPSEAAAYYRQRFLTCHMAASCSLPKPRRLEYGDDCAGCHTPKRGVEVIAHSALTNHRIIVRPDEPLPEAAFTQVRADLPDLVYVNRPTSADRVSLPPVMRLQTYGELRDRDPTYQRRYFELLGELSKTGKAQPLVEAALGRKLLHARPASNATAINHLTRAIELGCNASAVFEDLAEALARAGREEEAISPLEHGIELAPYTPCFQVAGAALH